ncbi:MAG: helix-turn-helix domain-containing protein [Candidatus Thermoplasmatota archaeon]
MDAFDNFRLMLDEYASQILALTAERAMNATELSDALGIPMAACYRRIRMLKGAGMLREQEKAVSAGGKSVSLYRSTVESAEVVLTDGRLQVKIRANGQDSSGSVSLTDEATMLHWMPRKEGA